MNLGTRIKKSRAALLMTQRKLAKKLASVTDSCVILKKNQRSVSDVNLQKIAKVLKVSLDYLMEGGSEPTVIESIRFNTQSPKGLSAAIESVKCAKTEYIPVKPEFLIETFEELLEFRSKEEFIKPTKRPAMLTGRTIALLTGCGKMHVTVNDDDYGNMFEVLAVHGKAGGCASSQVSMMASLISCLLQHKAQPEQIIKLLVGSSCVNSNLDKDDRKRSCSDGMGVILNQVKDAKKRASK